MGIRGTQPRLRSRRHAWPPRCLNWCAAEQQNLHQSRDSAARCRASNSRTVAPARSNDGAHRCRHGIEGLRVSRVEMEECRLGHRDPSIRICFRGRRIEGYQARNNALPLGRPVLNVLRLWRAHTPYRLDEDWIFASPHYHGKTPYTYQILFRRHIQPVIERVSNLKSSKQAPIGWHTLRRSLATLLISNGENVKVAQSQLRHTTPKITLELYAQAVSADQQKAHKKVVQMVLPAKFPEKLTARSAVPTA
jgi:hypothetical protein